MKVIKTTAKDEEDLDLLCNTLNAEAGRFLYTDKHLYCVLIRAQAAITQLDEMSSRYDEKINKTE